MAKKKKKINIKDLAKRTFEDREVNKQKAIENVKKREEERRIRIEEEKKLERLRLEEEKRIKLEKEIKSFLFDTIKIRIKTLSPIHIGDGTEYEPTQYVIKDNKLYYFNEYFVLEKLFELGFELPKEDEMLDIYLLVSYFRKNVDLIIKNNLYISKISVSKDIVKLYNEEFGKSKNCDEVINQMLINKHISCVNPISGEFEAYIPGSSLKGAFQTVLDLSDEEARRFKVSDSIGIDVKEQIAWSIRRTEKNTTGIPQKLEVIYTNSIYEFEIRKSLELSMKDLINKLHNFYKDADLEEYNKFILNVKNENQFLLRVGRYNGKNFIVKGLDKKPKTKSVFRKQQKELRSELPFGWVLCEIIS